MDKKEEKKKEKAISIQVLLSKTVPKAHWAKEPRRLFVKKTRPVGEP